MKRFSCAIFIALALVGCQPAKKVAVAPASGTPGVFTPPTEQVPDQDLPPVQNPSDGTIQLDEIENAALADIQDKSVVSTADEKNTVYLSAANFQNDGDDVNVAKQGALMGLNLLSNQSFIRSVRPLKNMPSVFAVKLTDFFGSSGNANAIWKTIEDTAVLKIVSQTSRGRNLQVITGKQIPVMHLQVFLETAFLAKNYYAIKGIPTNLNTFLAQKGVDPQALFDDRDSELFLANFQISQIAPGHNRHVVRLFGKDGACWLTKDIDSLQLNDPVFAEKANYSKFPFPLEARSQTKTFNFSASELLCRQPNGLFSGSLFNAAGVRADVAPTTVVLNLRASPLGLDADIKPRDCAGCHTTFVLPFKDEARRQIQDSPFSASDKLLGQLFFKPQNDIDNVIQQDNDEHATALALMGIQPGNSDPMNAGVIDKLRRGFTLKQLASFLYLSEGEFSNALAGSQDAANELGQVTSGGTVGFFALQASVNNVINDLNLFRDVQ